MLKKLPELFNFKKIFILIFLMLPTQSFADNIRDFKIEGMSIGDSALNYFSESLITDGEQGWHNYSYNEYSTSLVPGKGIYDWFLLSYRGDDDDFIIEALVGGLEQKNFNNKECKNKIDAAALNLSELFKKTKQDKKKYNLTADASRTYPFTGKSTVTSLSFNFNNKGEIVLSCYYVDKKANEKDTFVNVILNHKDSFRINVRSRVFVNYLKNNNKK